MGSFLDVSDIDAKVSRALLVSCFASAHNESFLSATGKFMHMSDCH
jgi:hypothetical protein